MLKDQVIIKDRKTNCVKFSTGESWPHALRKMEVCYWLRNNGYTYYTEANFEKGGRADIVVVHPEEFIIEVLHTEKLSNILKKKDVYPLVDIRVTRTAEQFKEKDIL